MPCPPFRQARRRGTAGGTAALKSRHDPDDPRHEEFTRLKAKIGDLTMANELLGAKRSERPCTNTRRSALGLLPLALVLFAGCCCLSAGTWEDDPGNWERAFKSTKPDDVTVVHSRYWCSPHWTYEYQYFFEIAPNARLKEQLFTENKLRQVTGSDAASVKNSFGEAPAWFAPKVADAYDIYIYEEEPRGNFKVLIDKETGTIFMADTQV